MYGTEVSPSLISSVTDAVSDEVKAWQARPLDAIYPIVYLDCIHVKVREGVDFHAILTPVFHPILTPPVGV